MLVHVAARSKAQVWDLSPAEIVGSNHTGGMGVCRWVLCVVQVEVSATSWSLVQKSPKECGPSLRVIKKPRDWGGPAPRGAAVPKTKQKDYIAK
jgi:hypothetical protein